MLTIILQKENIAINSVLPGIVHTNIIPPEMVAAVSAEAMTPVSQIVSAYMRFLDHPDTSLSGEALECAALEQIFVPRPQYLNGDISRRACTVWDVSTLRGFHAYVSPLIQHHSHYSRCTTRSRQSFLMPFLNFADQLPQVTCFSLVIRK